MIHLIGKISQGFGAATKTIAAQRSLFEKLGLKDVERLRDGTINIDISPNQFFPDNYDYFFKSVEWENGNIEDFGFIKIDKIIYQGQTYNGPGYIYVPHNSPHFSKRNQIEVLAIPIAGAQAGIPIEIIINHWAKTIT